MNSKDTQGIYGINANKNSLHTRKRRSTNNRSQSGKKWRTGADLSKKVG